MTRRWRRAPEVLWRNVLDGVVALAPSTEEPVVLGGVSALLWQGLRSPSDLDDLIDGLRRCGIEVPEDAPSVVVGALEDLEQHGLVEPA